MTGDKELLARQAGLPAEAAGVLAELDLGSLFGDVGPVLVVGSYLSGLMCWRDLDVGLLAGEAFSPSEVLELLHRDGSPPPSSSDVGWRGRPRPAGAARYFGSRATRWAAAWATGRTTM